MLYEVITTSLVFTRQSLPQQQRDEKKVANIARGGYVLSEAGANKPQAIILATGSEVELAMQAQKLLADKGTAVRVVSIPCDQVFDAQDAAYREAVLPVAVQARVAVEAGVTHYWSKYVGQRGRVIGIDRFGESAPGNLLMEYFGFTAANVVKAVEAVIREA